MSSSAMVDWSLAVRLGTTVGGDGPTVSPGEARAVVRELREGAHRSTALVRDFTGLDAEQGTAPVLVVDRAGWIQANADSFATILSPMIDKMESRKGANTGLTHAIGSRVSGAEMGLVLGLLSSRVLGQFDPFHDPAGRLLLVAPNIVRIEREINADPTDFRLWVCLHEETHRVQFTAVPWMREHIFSLIEQVMATVEPQALADQIKQMAAAAAKRGGASADHDTAEAAEPTSLLSLFSSPEQRAILDQVTGVMSLLEGHADVVMDGVGPSVIPSVDKIRASFNTRRGGVGLLDKILRRVLGMDAKLAQYRDGAAFVRHVVDKVGMQEFNTVWADPSHLPTKVEIADPALWISRVL